MSPKQMINIVNFIKGKNKTKLIAENNTQAVYLANVLFESKKLYEVVNNRNSSLEEVLSQIEAKNIAAKNYKEKTGKIWPL